MTRQDKTRQHKQDKTRYDEARQEVDLPDPDDCLFDATGTTPLNNTRRAVVKEKIRHDIAKARTKEEKNKAR